MRKVELVVLGIILLSFVIGICLYSLMPEELASHWNAQGQVNGYMSKIWGLFLMPLVSLGVFLLFISIPRIDPLKANIKKFMKYYYGFVLLMILFLFYLYILTILWNFGMRFDMIKFLIPTFGILYYYIGILTEHTKRNWFIGLRTPWTISSEKIWNKTNKLGGKLLKIAGLIALIGFFFESYSIFFVLIPVILVVVYTTIYSYLEYQKRK